MKTFTSSGLILALLLSTASVATAGGYDTPILYSARHMGMGGTGIAAVYDPTAAFLNPAGFGHTDFISLTLNLSPIIATNDSVPEGGVEATAGPTLAPAFLVGAGFRVWDYITLGIGIYPIASAGGGYEYEHPISKAMTTDETSIRFFELSPTITFNYEDLIRIGIGYRITMAQLVRLKKQEGATGAMFDLDLAGFDFTGLRVGIQATPIEGLDIGVVYRHRIDPVITADSSSLILTEYGKTEFPLHLPSRLGAGIRYDVWDLGFALDYEYAFQSQNDLSVIKAAQLDDPSKAPLELNSWFNWTDASTVRVGVEYRFLEGYSARLGYVWDEITSNVNYSSAFGTPPNDTHSATLGFGYKSERWEINGAYAYRTGSKDVTQADVDAREDLCLTCSYPGPHELTLHGLYIDFSWYFAN